MTKDQQIKNLKQELNRYKELSTHDFLTGVYNKRKVENDIKRFLQIYNRTYHSCFYHLFILDLDNFKSINDTYGHKYGDNYLVNFTNLLHKTIRPTDRLYRIGGDEFLIITINCYFPSKFIKRLNKYIKISYSIGYSKLTSKNSFQIADKKMYENKKGGIKRGRDYEKVCGV